MTSHEIDYRIYGEEMQYVEIELDPQEGVVAEAGSFMMMDDGIKMETIFGDGSQKDTGFLGKILGAGLDVLEYEKSSFEDLFKTEESRFRWMRKGKKTKLPEAFQYLIQTDNVLLTPHVAGWTVESKRLLAQTIVNKIKAKFL